MAAKIKKTIINLNDVNSIRAGKKKVKNLRRNIGNSKLFYRYLKRKVSKLYLDPLMVRLHEPPANRSYPIDYPLQWVSEEQRKAVMAKIGEGGYEPTGKMNKEWDYEFKLTRRAASVIIKNESPYVEYVKGKWGAGWSSRSVNRYLKPIQPFHRKYYEPAYIPIRDAIRDIREEAQNLYEKWISDEI